MNSVRGPEYLASESHELRVEQVHCASQHGTKNMQAPVEQHQDPEKSDARNIVHAQHTLGQEVADYMAAIERRKRNEIEESEQKVQQQGFIDDQRDGHDR